MNLRQQLVEQRAEQRIIKQEMDRIEALATLSAVGKNAEERKANLTLTLAGDPAYQDYWQKCHVCQTNIERLEAQIEDVRDQRREHEWVIRERLVKALERRGLAGDGFDEVGDEANWHLHTVDLEPPF